MTRILTCIQCPQGCRLAVEAQDGYLISLSGNRCAKGETYARQELENPERTLTTTVQALGLALAWIPVKTSRPIPKARLQEAMVEIRRHQINQPVRAGDIVIKHLLGMETDVKATRTVPARKAPG